ncbi:MAG: hypothetical protein RLZZ381_156 [Cyanobacteriota bacterium]|jgi:hypothetical protein
MKPIAIAKRRQSPIKPQNLPETLIWYYIVGTYVIYFLGAQYILASLLGFLLVLYLVWQWWNQTAATPPDEKITIPPSVWVWVVAMLVLEGATIVSHADFQLGLKRFIETFAAWSRTWAIFAIFPLAASLKIRPQIIYRAVCIVCLQSLILIIIGSLATLAKIPEISYVSPLGSLPLDGGKIQYEVDLIHSVIDNRLRLFTPWSPALGLTANIYFCLILPEQNKQWRWIGIVATITMILGSVSRTAILCLPTVLLLELILTKFSRGWLQLIAAGFSFIGGLYFPTLIEFINTLKESVRNFRAGSSKARDILERIALERWWNEAPIWGHGMTEPGPEWLNNVPIGTHHTWFGLLFTHGLVGSIALATALFWSFIDLLIKAQNHEHARIGLKIVLTLIIFSFSEHFDGSVFVFWPGLIILGMAFQERQSSYLLPKLASITEPSYLAKRN